VLICEGVIVSEDIIEWKADHKRDDLDYNINMEDGQIVR